MADTPPSTILMPLDNDNSDDDEEQEYAVVQCAFPLDLTPAQATEAIVAATAIVGPDGWETTLHIEFSREPTDPDACLLDIEFHLQSLNGQEASSYIAQAEEGGSIVSAFEAQVTAIPHNLLGAGAATGEGDEPNI